MLHPCTIAGLKVSLAHPMRHTRYPSLILLGKLWGMRVVQWVGALMDETIYGRMHRGLDSEAWNPKTWQVETIAGLCMLPQASHGPETPNLAGGNKREASASCEVEGRGGGRVAGHDDRGVAAGKAEGQGEW